MNVYRYQKMVNQFLKLNEYEGYRMDMTILKSVYFRKVTKKGTYIIKILEGAYYDAVVFKQRTEDKHYERIPYENMEKSVKQLVKMINTIMKKANEHYEGILPFYEHMIEKTLFKVTSIVEDIPSYKQNPLAYPCQLIVWMDIWKENEKIGDIQWVIQNKSPSETYGKWEVGTKKVTYQQGECGYKEVECLRKKLTEQLNKPNRIRHLF